MKLPLEGITVLEFSQYLAGPYAGLRLADLGARVIKVERPGAGDACRRLATKNLYVEDDSLVFHTINRNKESFAANLKDPADIAKVKQLIATADVMTHNFRPGVMEKIGLDYETVKRIQPSIIYATVTGYGKVGPWKDKPGQDLLAQSMSGLTWLTGKAGGPPVPFGMAIADMLCGTHLAQGILAALVQKGRTGQGTTVETSLIESMIDFQFEVLTTHLNDGGQLPQRAKITNAHAYLGAPYGIYPTVDGHIAIAMGSLETLGQLIGCRGLEGDPFEQRDVLQEKLAAHFATQTTQYWLDILEPVDYWCADVFNYARLMEHAAYKVLQMDQRVQRPSGATIKTTRCPIRIDGKRLFSSRAAPVLGEANERLEQEVFHG
jgi:crotonobetainyl-CoA:carnitine CoA-transferase CaiB-like acyl-CoA transferase